MRSIRIATFVATALALSGTANAVIDDLVPMRVGKDILTTHPNIEYHPTSVLVRFHDQTPIQAKDLIRAVVGGQKIRQYNLVPGLEQIEVNIDVHKAIAKLNAFAFVDYAEPDYVVRHQFTPNDTFYTLQWGLNNTGQTVAGSDRGKAGADINAPEAWNISTGDAGFVVAVIDTGTQWNHPDLAANMWVNPGETAGNGIDDDGNGYVDDIRGWDFFSNDNNPMDEEGHGTHTAGTVGAIGNNGIGVAGVMWSCQIMPLRFLGPNGGFISDAISATQYATDKGVKVSNNSWSGGGFSQGLYDAIDASRAVGHLFVAAAGNDGSNNDLFPSYPSSYDLDNIISVAATDNNDRKASFSNTGKVSVDLGAPGVNVASTYMGSQYFYSSGTSMASPHVAGVAALVYIQNPTWTYSQVRNQILNTTRFVRALRNKTATDGCVDAFAALGG